VGLAEDGSFAGSMQAGLLVLCDLPDELSAGTDLKPQRMQAVIGFAYTAANSEAEPGGFGIGDLGSGVLGQSFTAPASLTPSALPTATPAFTPVEAAAAPAPAPTKLQARPAASRLAPLADFAMDPATRWVLGLVCVVVWAALTHAGARKLRQVTSA
jgi:hypothetical protein